jgi:hypothetical protein
MRSFRAARFLVLPALVIPLMLSTTVLSGTAWAKGGSKPIKCQSVAGSYGGSWSLNGCTQPTIVGTGNPQGSIASSFPTSPATITWGEPVNRDLTPVTTVIRFTVSQLTGRKDKCHGGLEYSVVGTIVSNSRTPGVKTGGKLKMFVCDVGGALSAHKPARL